MATVDAMPYLPFTERGTVVDGTFRWRLGLRPLDLATWFDFGPDALGEQGWIADKARIGARHAETVFAVLDDIADEADEVAAAVVEHLRIHHPTRSRDLDDRLHKLEAAARLVPEDFVLMVERDGRLVCGGGSVSFPNRWDLRSKLGRTMAEVHAPVADLNAQLGAPVDDFLRRLRPERSYWRLGWGIIDVADGYAPVDGTGGARPEHPTAADMHLRVERETLRRFPLTRCVLFTIRTYVMPIDRLTGPDARSALAESLAAMSDAVRDYKDLVDHADELVRLLRAES